MASNHFGQLFKITTWGESHGRAIGVVIDGCPAGLELDSDYINTALAMRAPGNSPYTSPRKEPDLAEIYSGIFDGITTGAPISIIIENKDADPSKYEAIKNIVRPGHANFTYINKYGCFDHRGGGRASARETACRVAAGAVAQKLLTHFDIKTLCFLKSVATFTEAHEMKKAIEQAKADGDSLGGIVEFNATGLAIGLGDPIYEKLEAKLAAAMMSIPASKGFEIGDGFAATTMKGSEHNDLFNEDFTTESNHAGGVLAGISNGMPIVGRVAFKPTSSIAKSQASVDLHGNKTLFELPSGSRHDPCVAIRAVPVVDAMLCLVLADLVLMDRIARLTP